MQNPRNNWTFGSVINNYQCDECGTIAALSPLEVQENGDPICPDCDMEMIHTGTQVIPGLFGQFQPKPR